MNRSVLVLAYGCLLLIALSCQSGGNKQIFTDENQEQLILDSSHNLPFKCIIDTPFCADSACTGIYRGVEFVSEHYIGPLELNGTDVAH
jgi:hypothetical protein